ncbi:MAG: AEC family transporter [Proteobacteria bacterium]|nr:AEC family transporter [Pseudomonadota bacterium]MBU1610595.1 AEC family transporter [Pseudomonadota bacterium]
MDRFAHIAEQVLPILLLLGLGRAFGRWNFLSQTTVDDLKRLVVNVALPSVLFLSFLKIELHISYLSLFFVILAVCVGLYFLGCFGARFCPEDKEELPFLMTGFEYGMLGISLFGGAYGLDAIGYIAVVDLGHEFFIWFVYLALLISRQEGGVRPGRLASMFVTSPVILAVCLGLGLNAAGFGTTILGLPVFGAVGSALELLGALTVPLVLIIVGYGVRIERSNLCLALAVTTARVLVCVPLALLLNVYVLRGMLGLGRPFELALFTLFILPPPFILPLFMKGKESDLQRVNSVLAVHTVVSVFLFIGFLAMNPVL